MRVCVCILILHFQGYHRIAYIRVNGSNENILLSRIHAFTWTRERATCCTSALPRSFTHTLEYTEIVYLSSTCVSDPRLIYGDRISTAVTAVAVVRGCVFVHQSSSLFSRLLYKPACVRIRCTCVKYVSTAYEHCMFCVINVVRQHANTHTQSNVHTQSYRNICEHNWLSSSLSSLAPFRGRLMHPSWACASVLSNLLIVWLRIGATIRLRMSVFGHGLRNIG